MDTVTTLPYNQYKLERGGNRNSKELKRDVDVVDYKYYTD